MFIFHNLSLNMFSCSGYVSNYFKDTCIKIEPDTIRNQLIMIKYMLLNPHTKRGRGGVLQDVFFLKYLKTRYTRAFHFSNFIIENKFCPKKGTAKRLVGFAKKNVKWSITFYYLIYLRKYSSIWKGLNLT